MLEQFKARSLFRNVIAAATITTCLLAAPAFAQPADGAGGAGGTGGTGNTAGARADNDDDDGFDDWGLLGLAGLLGLLGLKRRDDRVRTGHGDARV